jgi:hypothetical protein
MTSTQLDMMIIMAHHRLRCTRSRTDNVLMMNSERGDAINDRNVLLRSTIVVHTINDYSLINKMEETNEMRRCRVGVLFAGSLTAADAQDKPNNRNVTNSPSSM